MRVVVSARAYNMCCVHLFNKIFVLLWALGDGLTGYLMGVPVTSYSLGIWPRARGVCRSKDPGTASSPGT